MTTVNACDGCSKRRSIATIWRASAAFYTTLLDVTPMLETDRLVAIDAGEGTVLLLFQRAPPRRSRCRAG